MIANGVRNQIPHGFAGRQPSSKTRALLCSALSYSSLEAVRFVAGVAVQFCIALGVHGILFLNLFKFKVHTRAIVRHITSLINNNNNTIRQSTYDVTLKRDCVTIATVEKQ